MRGCGFPRCPRPLAVVTMSAIGNWRSGNIRGEEVASLPLVREERHDVVVVERKVREGVSVEEKGIRRCPSPSAYSRGGGRREKSGDGERVEMLEEELKDAVLCEDYEDFGGWC